MSLRVACEGCQKSFAAPDEAAGKTLSCPACGQSIHVPAGGESSANSATVATPTVSAPANDLSDLLADELSADPLSDPLAAGGQPLATSPLGRQPRRRRKAAGEPGRPNPLGQFFKNNGLAVVVGLLGGFYFATGGLGLATTPDLMGWVASIIMRSCGLIGIGIAIHGLVLKRQSPEGQEENVVEKYGGQAVAFAFLGLFGISLFNNLFTISNVEGIPDKIRNVIIFNMISGGVIIAAVLLCFAAASQRWGLLRAGGYTYLAVFAVLPLTILLVGPPPLGAMVNPKSAAQRRAQAEKDRQQPTAHQLEHERQRREIAERKAQREQERATDERRRREAEQRREAQEEANRRLAEQEAARRRRLEEERRDAEAARLAAAATTDGSGGNPTTPPDKIQPARTPTLTGPAFVKASHEYRRQAMIDAIAGPDARIKDRLKWIPGMKRPMIGVRFGVGVYVTGVEVQPNVQSMEDLAKITGVAGPMLVTRLQEQIGAGDFGEWPAAEDERFRQVAALRGGAFGDIRERAEALGVDVVVLFTLTRRIAAGSGRQSLILKARVSDLVGKAETFTSTSLTSDQIAAAQRAGQDAITPFVDETLAFIEENYAVKPMPALTPELAAKRAKSIAVAEMDAPFKALVEVRYYHAMGMIDNPTAEECYDHLLHVGAGDVMISGDEAARRELLAKVGA